MGHHARGRLSLRQRLTATGALLLLIGTSTFLTGGVAARAATGLTGSPYDGSDGAADVGVVFHNDQPSGNTDNVYVQGATEATACPVVDNTHSAPQNDDITSYAVTSSRGSNGHVFLYVAWNRVNNKGTPTIEYEFNQSTTDCGNGVNPVRTPNDFRIIYNFHGGTVDNISKSTWNGSWNTETAISSSQEEASIASSNELFGEAVIDLTAAGTFEADSCTTVASGFARSRSSAQSGGDELKDLVLPTAASISNCGSVSLHKTDDLGNDLAGATFGLYTDKDATTLATGITGANPCTTNDSGVCGWTNVQPGDYFVKEVRAPAGYDADSSVQSVTVVAEGSTAPENDFVDPRQTGVLRIHKAVEDANGDPVQVDPADLNGASFTVLNKSGGTQAHLWDKAGTDAGCTISNDLGYCDVGPLATGNYIVHETAAPVGTGLTAPDQDVAVTQSDGEGGVVNVTMTNAQAVSGISVEKSGPAVAHEGETVTYSFKVTNTGNVPLANVTVTDDVLGTIGSVATLAVGASTTLTKDFTIPVGNTDITNTATACGNDPLRQQTCDTDKHTLDPIHPAIAIDKTVNDAAPHSGDTVTFSYKVTNTGDTTLLNVSVDDDILGHIGDIASLAPGASTTLTKDEVVNGSTPVTNVGTAKGKDVLGKEVSAHDDANVQVVLGLVITKNPAALATTGVSIALELQWAAGLMVVGILLTVASRRRVAAERSPKA